ncbi:Bug family tripartite tricarboxylate transporter substrate binding protein [Ramlibacter sp.]|uniref:Bug family tripartite tricarboxylate transporter substrate binding protein n=1 Tax=Ramlibacter sp. TaxID=1917967 RepID=UPI003D152B7D
MKRRDLPAAIAALAGIATSRGAFAQDAFPSRPLKLVVPWAAGGVNDSLGRLAADRMGAVLKQSIVADNRAGGNGVIGTQTVLQAPPDGYTMLLTTSGQHVLSVALGIKLPYQPLNDLTHIAQIGEFPLVLVAKPSFAANTLPELLALAKSKPGKLNVAVSGIGAISHLTAERLMGDSGTSMTVVNYKGEAPSIQAAMAGEVDFAIVAQATSQIREKLLKAIATTGPKRWNMLPEVPTLIEGGLPGFTAGGWSGLAVSAKTSPQVVDVLARAARTALDTDDVRTVLRSRGVEPMLKTPAELIAMMRADAEKYRVLVQSRNIKLES